MKFRSSFVSNSSSCSFIIKIMNDCNPAIKEIILKLFEISENYGHSEFSYVHIEDESHESLIDLIENHEYSLKRDIETLNELHPIGTNKARIEYYEKSMNDNQKVLNCLKNINGFSIISGKCDNDSPINPIVDLISLNTIEGFSTIYKSGE